MAPFTAAQIRLRLTTLGFGVGRYLRPHRRVGTKGAPVALLLLTVLGHTADVRFYPLAAAGVPFDPMVLTGLCHTDHLLS